MILPIPDVWVHDGWIALLIAAVAPLVMIDEPPVYYRQHSENQIGAVRRKREDARSPFSAIYSTRIAKFTCATARLQNKTDNAPVSEEILSRIGPKIKHLEARASMPTSRWRRLPIALRKLIALRYHRYAKGTRSFTKYLFRCVSEV